MYTLLLSLGNPMVSLMVLDVEGAETLILRTVPWDKVDIEVIILHLNIAGVYHPQNYIMEQSSYRGLYFALK